MSQWYELPIWKTVLEKEKTFAAGLEKISGPRDSYKVFAPWLKGADKEYFLAMYLTTQNDIIGLQEVARGTLAETPIFIREICKVALLLNARSVVVAHNHPSFDCTPSEQDIRATKCLIETLRVLEIGLLDHLVIGDPDKDGDYTSIFATIAKALSAMAAEDQPKSKKRR